MDQKETVPQLKIAVAVAALAVFMAAAPGLASASQEEGTQAAAEETHEDQPPAAVIELPRQAGDGPGKEVSVLLDDTHLKLAILTLRQGTVLPAHSAPVPTTIQVLQGSGVIHIDDQPIEVRQGSLVPLAAGSSHDVRPLEGSDMVLLVHYLRGGAAPGSATHEH